MRVLVVEDSTIMALALKRALATAGYQDVSVSTNAEQALALVEKQPFDLLIVDWMLPGMSGLDLVRRVRAEPAGAQIAIIMATAKDAKADFLEALRAGADDYILKPVRFESLVEKIGRVLQIREGDAPDLPPPAE